MHTNQPRGYSGKAEKTMEPAYLSRLNIKVTGVSIIHKTCVRSLVPLLAIFGQFLRPPDLISWLTASALF